MDFIIKIAARLTALFVRIKAARIVRQAENEMMAYGNKLDRADYDVEKLALKLNAAQVRRDEINEQYKKAGLRLTAATSVRDHYMSCADEVLGFH